MTKGFCELCSKTVSQPSTHRRTNGHRAKELVKAREEVKQFKEENIRLKLMLKELIKMINEPDKMEAIFGNLEKP